MLGREQAVVMLVSTHKVGGGAGQAVTWAAADGHALLTWNGRAERARSVGHCPSPPGAAHARVVGLPFPAIVGELPLLAHPAYAHRAASTGTCNAKQGQAAGPPEYVAGQSAALSQQHLGRCRRQQGEGVQRLDARLVVAEQGNCWGIGEQGQVLRHATFMAAASGVSSKGWVACFVDPLTGINAGVSRDRSCSPAAQRYREPQV